MFIQEGKLTSLTNKTTCHEKGKSCGYQTKFPTKKFKYLQNLQT